MPTPGDGGSGWSAARVACLILLVAVGVAVLGVFYLAHQLASAIGHGLSGLLRPCNK